MIKKPRMLPRLNLSSDEAMAESLALRSLDERPLADVLNDVDQIIDAKGLKKRCGG
jgi:hypothetical protein